MKWHRVSACEWVLLVAERGEVGCIVRDSYGYAVVTLSMLMMFARDLPTAKRMGQQSWVRAERKYAAAARTIQRAGRALKRGPV